MITDNVKVIKQVFLYFVFLFLLHFSYRLHSLSAAIFYLSRRPERTTHQKTPPLPDASAAERLRKSHRAPRAEETDFPWGFALGGRRSTRRAFALSVAPPRDRALWSGAPRRLGFLERTAAYGRRLCFAGLNVRYRVKSQYARQKYAW